MKAKNHLRFRRCGFHGLDQVTLTDGLAIEGLQQKKAMDWTVGLADGYRLGKSRCWLADGDEYK